MVENNSPNPVISIIVPTRNEAANIWPLLARLAAAMTGLAVEVYFVDDSSDGTVGEIAAAAQAQPGLTVRWLARPPAQRNGLSGAVVDGLRQVRGEWVGVMDADLQHPPEMMRQLYRYGQETGADIIVGSRQGTLLGPLGLSRARALTSQMLTILARALFPQLLKNVSDPLTGLFLVRRARLDTAVLRPDGFKILLEILVRTPNLRVSELHFDFARRHSGQSKADFREGVRFFRHLLRLRLTANRWFGRYVAARSLAMAAHLLLLWALVAGLGLHYLLAAVGAGELIILLNFWLTDRWIFSDAEKALARQRLSRFWLVNQFYLLLRLPVLAALVTVAGWHYLPAAALAIVVGGMVKYGASEQWIWNRGLSWQRPYHHYNLHDILGIESQVALPDLAAFRVDQPPAQVQIRLHVDRHGTPNCQPGAICYDESLGRFGFGIAVMPATCTELVIAPALARAPFVLYKSVLEPLLRWHLAGAGVVMLPVAATAVAGQATLLVAEQGWPKTRAVLRQVWQSEAQFLGDEGVLLRRDGQLFSLPRPISLTAQTLPLAVKTKGLARLKAAFYSSSWRRLGIWLSRRRWPLATLNVLLQRLVPPPKTAVSQIQPPVATARSARLAHIVVVRPGASPSGLSLAEAAAILDDVCGQVTGFPPYPYLTAELESWQGADLRAAEREIIMAAVQSSSAWQSSGQGIWWQLPEEQQPAPDRPSRESRQPQVEA
jgi:dolichol-phosphate mannosyltransferase